MSRDIPMDHGDTKICLGDHFIVFVFVLWSQNIQDEKEHLMFNVMNQGSISFQTLGRVAFIGFLCVVNWRLQAAERTRWGLVDPLLRAPRASKC